MIHESYQCTAHIGPLSDQYILPISSNTKQYGEPCFIHLIVMEMKGVVNVLTCTISQ